MKMRFDKEWAELIKSHERRLSVLENQIDRLERSLREYNSTLNKYVGDIYELQKDVRNAHLRLDSCDKANKGLAAEQRVLHEKLSQVCSDFLAIQGVRQPQNQNWHKALSELNREIAFVVGCRIDNNSPVSIGTLQAIKSRISHILQEGGSNNA